LSHRSGFRHDRDKRLQDNGTRGARRRDSLDNLTWTVLARATIDVGLAPVETSEGGSLHDVSTSGSHLMRRVRTRTVSGSQTG